MYEMNLFKRSLVRKEDKQRLDNLHNLDNFQLNHQLWDNLSDSVIREIQKELGAVQIELLKDIAKINTLEDIKYRNG